MNDNLASNQEGKFLQPFNYVIIDEIDDILLDSAQTPLIIAGSPRVQSNYYGIIDTLVTTLVEGRIISLRRKRMRSGSLLRELRLLKAF